MEVSDLADEFEGARPALKSYILRITTNKQDAKVDLR